LRSTALINFRAKARAIVGIIYHGLKAVVIRLF
jgi:hypothetical protein